MINRFNFTMNRLQDIPIPSKRTVYYDDGQPGLRLLVTPTGNKSFQFQMWSKKHRKPLTRTLGKFRTISLLEARRQAAALIIEINTGIDIERVQAESNRTRLLEPTVQDFSKIFIERYCKAKGLKSIKETQRILNKDILPNIGKIKMSDVKKQDIVHLLDIIQDRGAKILCNRTLSVLSKMFNFASERDVIAFSPVFGIKKPGIEIRRERVLSNQEIKILWNSLGDSMSSMLIKFLLLTGQRTGETRQAEWSEISENVWHIPPTKTKNKRANSIPLSSGALAIIDHIKPFSKGRYLFPGKKHGSVASDQCLDKDMPGHHFQRVISKLKWERTTVHDLRRTMRSKLSELGVVPIVAEKILNHIIPGILPVYDRYDYFNEKKEALQKWNDYLETIINLKTKDIDSNS
jgi:integrase